MAMLKSFWGNPFKKEKSAISRDIELLSRIPIFKNLSFSQKRNIFEYLHLRTYGENEIVFRQGDPGAGLYIIREGHVDVYTEYADMTKKKITSFSVGDFFGEIALLNDNLRSATVISTTKTVLYGLFKPDLHTLMDSNPKLGQKFLYGLAQTVVERLVRNNEEPSRLS